MNALDFLEQLAQALPETWPPTVPQGRANWTAHMVERLHQVCTGAGMSCVCSNRDPHTSMPGQPAFTREVLFDFCWYADPSDYALPTVVIEHENSPHPRDFFYDLWKLMVARAPLRVMIGYAPQDRKWGDEDCLEAINRIASESHWSFPDETEDLILVGTAIMPTPRAFTVYLRPAGARQFQHMGDLGSLAATASPRALLDDALVWLRSSLHGLAPYNERDIVFSLQRHIARRIANHQLPYEVYNDYPMLYHEGQRRHRSADLVIRKKGQSDRWPVELAVELKYEPDHKRSALDILAAKLPVTVWTDILKDGERIAEMVATYKTQAGLAVLIDAGNHHHKRHPEAPEGWHWELWADDTWVLVQEAVAGSTSTS